MTEFGKNIVISEILRQERCAGYIESYIPPDFCRDLSGPYTNTRSMLKIFSGIESKYPVERVARVNKALLREVVLDAVKQKVFHNRLPYIHVAYYPKGYTTLFAFRVDCDKCDRISFLNLVKQINKHEIPVTFFIDVKAQQEYLPEVAAIRKEGHDVQLHCYLHKTYNNRRNNERNIRHGKELLEEKGVAVRGFAAPYGQWNTSLNEVLEDLNFSFSSEFAMGYDDMPFYPVLKNRGSGVIQIPIHPVCIGSLNNAGVFPEEMNTYFSNILKMKYRRRSPIILYGHPRNEMDRFPGTVDCIFNSIKELNDVWITDLTSYADWWLKRLNAEYSVSFENEYLRINTQNEDQNLQLHIERYDSTEAFVPLIDSRIDLSQIQWSVKKNTHDGPSSELN